ncbi:MAG: tyrosine-type recombinase/integrase [Lachnospiraceae bacterium]|nr:tyrosine-type recombinase/integrase [Candidatus Minthocola equi]
MKEKIISEEIIERFETYLCEEEKSENTKEKYIRDVKAFAEYCGGNAILKETVIAYKQSLIDSGYAAKSINSMLASINSLFSFLDWYELRVKALKVQQRIFCPEEKELTRPEYERLCRTAERKHNERLSLILQTICGTGIRVSELQFISVEAVRKGEATVSLKGKTRAIIITKNLQKKLLYYISEQKLTSGAVFVTRTGKPISRTNIWREMKNLCIEAEVNPEKVFPHNLRHLFARVFYGIEKDIAKLADILGHSSINTTRIYIISTGTEHRLRMEQMRLIL